MYKNFSENSSWMVLKTKKHLNSQVEHSTDFPSAVHSEGNSSLMGKWGVQICFQPMFSPYQTIWKNSSSLLPSLLNNFAFFHLDKDIFWTNLGGGSKTWFSTNFCAIVENLDHQVYWSLPMKFRHRGIHI